MAVIETSHNGGELTSGNYGQFFAPISSDAVDALVAEYQQARDSIGEIAAYARENMQGIFGYFVSGNVPTDRRFGVTAVENVFLEPGAIAALNSDYWGRALALTDVLDLMPETKRQEWFDSIEKRTTPEFTDATVRDTLASMLALRAQFFAEKVDGVFRGLSGHHVTNSPMGFAKRMIINHVVSEYGSTDHRRCGLITDLRAAVAKFMGRDTPQWYTTSQLIQNLYRRGTGEWQVFDGGALKVRLYLKGTAHIEVHPEIAAKLNQVLAFLYPSAIPSEFRKKPTKKPKDYALLQRPLPFAVLDVLARGDVTNDGHGFNFCYSTADNGSQTYQEAVRVLHAIGAVHDSGRSYKFDYYVRDVVSDLLFTGCIPDAISHQFFPTPPEVAAKVVEMAQIGPDDTVLEPSAGNGDLAALLPLDRTICVEISALRCSVLKARGLTTVNADFIAWAKTASCVDRVVLNPPFSDGRAELHLRTAYDVLKPGGRLVAVMPASMRGKNPIAGCSIEWSDTIENAFANTGVSVAICAADKPLN
jgi:hypothetical protein